jgi:hypothetical protein
VILRISTFGLLVITALAVVAGQTPAFAGSAPAREVTVHVDSVLASDTNEGVDDKLSSMGHRLQSLFSYTTYQLVSHQDGQTAIGKLIAFDLPGGRILHVEPREIDGDMIAMDLVLFQGQRPLMTTGLKLRDHGVLIVGGPRYKEGMLIISIGCDAASGIKKGPSAPNTSTAAASDSP